MLFKNLIRIRFDQGIGKRYPDYLVKEHYRAHGPGQIYRAHGPGQIYRAQEWIICHHSNVIQKETISTCKEEL